MKWNDIKKHIARVNSTDPRATEAPTMPASSSPTKPAKERTHTVIRVVFLVVILIIIVLAVLVVIQLFKKHSSVPVLPEEQLREVSTFLDENPPTPMTTEQGTMINSTINKPVELNDADMESINNFLKQ